MLPKQIETRLGPKSHHTLPQTTDPASEIDSQAFFSSIDSSFQSFCCRSSSCSWTDTFSSALSFAHWASMFERGIGATREEVAVGGGGRDVDVVDGCGDEAAALGSGGLEGR